MAADLNTRTTYEPRTPRPMRRCVEPDCITILCSANTGRKCFLHTDQEAGEEPVDELTLRRLARREQVSPDPVAA